jgi:hypothetical protein
MQLCVSCYNKLFMFENSVVFIKQHKKSREHMWLKPVDIVWNYVSKFSKFSSKGYEQ